MAPFNPAKTLAHGGGCRLSVGTTASPARLALAPQTFEVCA